jgi:hypothetical protein
MFKLQITSKKRSYRLKQLNIAHHIFKQAMQNHTQLTHPTIHAPWKKLRNVTSKPSPCTRRTRAFTKAPGSNDSRDSPAHSAVKASATAPGCVVTATTPRASGGDCTTTWEKQRTNKNNFNPKKVATGNHQPEQGQLPRLHCEL